MWNRVEIKDNQVEFISERSTKICIPGKPGWYMWHPNKCVFETKEGFQFSFTDSFKFRIFKEGKKFQRLDEKELKSADIKDLFSEKVDPSEFFGEIYEKVTTEAPKYFEMVDLPAGCKLFPYQKEGVKKILELGSCILGDEMGLGKTVQALVAAASIGEKVVIVCPASLKINWKREIEKWTPDVEYEIFSWAKIPNPEDIRKYQHEYYVLIADEAHYAKSGAKSQRGKAFLRLSREAYRSILLTGTPMLNRPYEIYPLLKGIGSHLTGNWKDFVHCYCNAKKTKWGWDVSGSSNLDDLKIRLEDYMIRRERAKVLPEIPRKTRNLFTVEASSELKALVKEEKKLALEYKKSKDLKRRRASFEKIAAIRKLISAHKIQPSFEGAMDILKEKEKLVVFWHHKEPLFKMRDLLNESGIKTLCFHGGMNQEERQQVVDEFQNGDARVILLTFGAGAEGITLTAAHVSLMCECEWTPAKMMQAEDRTCRIGQTENVQIFYLVVDDSLDAHIAVTAKEKDEIIGVVVDGEQLNF